MKGKFWPNPTLFFMLPLNYKSSYFTDRTMVSVNPCVIAANALCRLPGMFHLEGYAG
jgi:hypothetical protein